GIWDASTGKAVRHLRDPVIGPGVFALSPDENVVALGTSDGITVWNLATGKRIHKTTAADTSVQAITFIDNNRFLSIGAKFTDLGDKETSVSFCDLTTGKETRRLLFGKQDEQILSARAISPDGRSVISAIAPQGISGVGGYLPPVY